VNQLALYVMFLVVSAIQQCDRTQDGAPAGALSAAWGPAGAPSAAWGPAGAPSAPWEAGAHSAPWTGPPGWQDSRFDHSAIVRPAMQ
jgi:hypothetical protein